LQERDGHRVDRDEVVVIAGPDLIGVLEQVGQVAGEFLAVLHAATRDGANPVQFPVKFRVQVRHDDPRVREELPCELSRLDQEFKKMGHGHGLVTPGHGNLLCFG
jgi:hypothetical protein